MREEMILERLENSAIDNKKFVVFYASIGILILLLFNYTTLFKIAAHLNMYQGTPLVVYVEEELASPGFGNREEWKSTVNFESKEARDLKLVRVDNIYQLWYMPTHFKQYLNPEQAWATLWSIGYYFMKDNNKKWQEISMAGNVAPYIEFPEGFASLKLKLFEMFAHTQSGKAAIWVDQDLAHIINLAPIETSKGYIGSKTDKKYVKLYPVNIKAIGEGYTFIEKETTSSEQSRYNYPSKIIVGIQKDYLSKVEFDK